MLRISLSQLRDCVDTGRFQQVGVFFAYAADPKQVRSIDEVEQLLRRNPGFLCDGRSLEERLSGADFCLCKFGEYPSEKFIHKLADALDCDEDELLLLTDRVPPAIQMRVLERPEAFRRIAELDDRSLDRLLDQIGSNRVHVKTP